MTHDARPLTLSAANVRKFQQTGTLVLEKLVRPQPGSPGYGYSFSSWDHGTCLHLYRMDDSVKHVYCPFGPVGTRFWVREQFDTTNDMPDGKVVYKNDSRDGVAPFWWKPARMMPREFARLFPVLLTVSVYQDAGVWRWRGEFGRVTE